MLPRGFDDPRRREQLRHQLAAAGVPEPAIEARTLADLGQAQAGRRRGANTCRERRRGDAARPAVLDMYCAASADAG
jgi:hypothetical protein